MLIGLIARKASRLGDEFADLVLGPKAIESKTNIFRSNGATSEAISEIDHLVNQLVEYQGQIVEISSLETSDLEICVEGILQRSTELGPVALLGFEAGRWRHVSNVSGIVMPARLCSEITFATHELLASEAIRVIVISEILYKPDYNRKVLQAFERLKGMAAKNDVLIVLLNPNTPERRHSLSELQLICSHHFEISS